MSPANSESFISSSPISLERDKGHGQMQIAFVERKCCDDAEVFLFIFNTNLFILIGG